jgi:heme oxygenase-like protein
MPPLPSPRGPFTAELFAALRYPPHALRPPPAPDAGHPLSDEDLQLALYCCYELHYRGFSDVDERWEWEPGLLAARAGLEATFEAALADLVPPAPCERGPGEMDVALREVADADDGPSVARFVEARASEAQLLEFLVHRSGYQLKEADPHSWAIPRLGGPPKAALVEIQADEYGGGNPRRVHARLFADAMGAVGLDPGYGAYLEHLPAPTLATVNLMSLFGLHRRLRGAIVGHLALFEMTSSAPNRRYGRGLRRLGFDTPEATRFFDEHVEADAVHENIAAVDLAGGLARQEPALADQIVWGARALVAIERRWAEHVLSAWEDDRCSLRYPAARRDRSSAALGAEKPDSLCVPSQNGRSLDFPQRQSATVERATSISRPS